MLIYTYGYVSINGYFLHKIHTNYSDQIIRDLARFDSHTMSPSGLQFTKWSIKPSRIYHITGTILFNHCINFNVFERTIYRNTLKILKDSI
jgi:hypothetical protein